MASRDPKDLTPAARAAWEKSRNDWIASGEKLTVFLTQTYRSVQEQNALFAQGRTKPGKIVTNARGGQSNHNKNPSPAFDVAFKDANGDINWNEKLFRRFAVIAKKNGLSWGGNWKKFTDLPHFELLEKKGGKP